MLFKVVERGETVVLLAIDNEGRQVPFYLHNRDECLQSAEVEIVVKRVDAERRIRVAQIRERITGFIAVATVARVAVEIEDGNGGLGPACRCELLGDEVVPYLEQRILPFQLYNLRIVISELILGVRKAVIEVGERAREDCRRCDAVAWRCFKKRELRFERERIGRELIFYD